MNSGPSPALNPSALTRWCAIAGFVAAILTVKACAPPPPSSDHVAASPQVVCGTAKLLAPDTISTDRSEVRLAISPDGSRRLWGAIDWQGGAGELDIWEQQRAEDGRWLKPVPVPFNSAANDFDPSFAPDGNGVYFFSNRTGGKGGDDLYYAPLDHATDTFGTARNLGAPVNTSKNEWAPTVSPDGKRLLFSSNGHGGRGKQDLFLAKRSNAGWESVEPLTSVNSPSDDFDASFLPDGEAIVFAVGNVQEGHAKLHVSSRRNNRWSAPQRLSSAVNAPETLNYGPSVSRAHPGMLFFSSHRTGQTRGRTDIYRIPLCGP